MRTTPEVRRTMAAQRDHAGTGPPAPAHGRAAGGRRTVGCSGPQAAARPLRNEPGRPGGWWARQQSTRTEQWQR